MIPLSERQKGHFNRQTDGNVTYSVLKKGFIVPSRKAPISGLVMSDGPETTRVEFALLTVSNVSNTETRIPGIWI